MLSVYHSLSLAELYGCWLFLEQTCSVRRHDEREAGAGGVAAGPEVVAATSRCAQRGGEARAAAMDEAEAEQADARVPTAGGGQARARGAPLRQQARRSPQTGQSPHNSINNLYVHVCTCASTWCMCYL